MKPWYSHANWTGKTPRTMQEAFGHDFNTLDKEAPPMGTIKHLLIYIGFFSAAIFAVSLISGVIRLW